MEFMGKRPRLAAGYQPLPGMLTEPMEKHPGVSVRLVSKLVRASMVPLCGEENLCQALGRTAVECVKEPVDISSTC